MENGVLDSYVYITNTLDSQGDSKLGPGNDPFLYRRLYATYVEAESKPGYHLTWRTLQTAVEGLYIRLFLRQKYKTATFSIWDHTLQAVIGTGDLALNVAISNVTVATNTTLIDIVGPSFGDVGLAVSR